MLDKRAGCGEKTREEVEVDDRPRETEIMGVICLSYPFKSYIIRLTRGVIT